MQRDKQTLITLIDQAAADLDRLERAPDDGRWDKGAHDHFVWSARRSLAGKRAALADRAGAPRSEAERIRDRALPLMLGQLREVVAQRLQQVAA